MSRQEDLAWAAGIIDGEGAVQITRLRPRSIFPGYGIRLNVTSTSIPMLKRLQSILGGSVGLERRSTDRERMHRVWFMSGHAAKTALARMEPNLTVKTAQAQVVGCFPIGPSREHGTRRTALCAFSQGIAWLVMRQLNRRGAHER